MREYISSSDPSYSVTLQPRGSKITVTSILSSPTRRLEAITETLPLRRTHHWTGKGYHTSLVETTKEIAALARPGLDHLIQVFMLTAPISFFKNSLNSLQSGDILPESVNSRRGGSNVAL